MAFLKSLLVGVGVILVLLILTSLQDSGGFEAIGLIFITLFVAPIILFIAIVNGIRQQSRQQQTEPAQENFTLFNIQFSRSFFLLVIIIFIVFFTLLILFFPHTLLPIISLLKDR